MEFDLDGLEEFYTDGVLNPRATSVFYQESYTKYRQLGDRVFLLYAPPTSSPDDAGASGADFDVVLLHGIGSDEFKCWTNQQGVLWPAVFLPQDFPTARVLTVGYAHSLFNWTAREATDAVTQVAAVAPDAVAGAAAADSAISTTSETTAAEKEGDHRRIPRPIEALAKRVEHSTRESVSAYAPEPLSEWWRRPAKAAPRNVSASEAAPATQAASAAGTPQEHTSSSPTHGSAQPATAAKAARHENLLFQLLARIRDSTGSLVSTEDGGPAAAHAHAENEAQAEANPSSTPAAAARDPRSLQSMRLVAAEVAERLLSPGVGVGQRPVVFMVHSMGGLILKQMLISLFEAARLAPPPVVPVSIDGGESPEKAPGVQQDSAQAGSHAAIRQATMLLRSVRGVVFYGTPHFGSAMASVITGLKKYYQGLGGLNPTSVVTGLGDHNRAELTRLNDRFFDVVERLSTELAFEESGTAGAAASAVAGAASAREFAAAMTSLMTPASASVWAAASLDGGRDAARGGPVCVLSFGETRKLNGLVRVVEPESANPAPEDPRYPFYLVNADHSEINRPVTKTSPSYAMLYGLLDRMQQRGLLGSGTAAGKAPSAFAAASPPPLSARDSDTVRRLQQRYEAGWATLFKSTLAATAADAKVTGPAGAGESASRRSVLSASVATYVRGVGEARLALPLLDSALEELRQLLHHFFGVAVPPQLDSVFLLAADMREFVDGFYRHERLADCVAVGTGPLADGVPDATQGRLTPVDEVVSFRVPLQIVLYWVRQATRMLRGFDKSQAERALRIGGGAGSDSAASTAAWEANMVLHPSSRDFRELGELEKSVGAVREDWEGFRRYVSLRVRAAVASSAGASQDAANAAEAAQPSTPPDVAPVADHIAALFFARTLRAIVADQLDDGGAVGGLLGAYLRSAILQLRGAESQLSPMHLENNVWLPLLRVASRSASASSSTSAGGSVVSLLMEGLELAAPSSRTTPDGSVLLDTSGHRVDLTTAAELRAITPALTATSAMLMGCFALYVDETHHLDAAARASAAATAAHHFRRAAAAMEADGQVRARLLRVAARTVQRGSPPPPPPSSSPNSKAGRGEAEWEWWRAARQLTTPRTTSLAAGRMAGGEPRKDMVAALVGEQGSPCSHVGVLDDGLFLSAMQLASAAMQCTPAIAACQSQVSPELDMVGATVPEAELMRAMEVGRKAYERTAKLVRGVLVIEDTEQPFGAGRKKGTPHPSGGDTDAAEERSAQERFRDTIRGLLRELESDGTTERDGGDADAAAVAANMPHQGKAPTSALTRLQQTPELPATASSVKPKSTKGASSLPMFIMNSLSEAWAAVRRGGVSVETPDYFAYSAMVLWWTAEWKAAAVLRASTAALSDPALRQRVHETLVAAEGARQRRWAATSSREAGLEERECWSHANAALRCGVLTLGGADHIMRALQSGLAQERGALNRLLDTTSVDALRATQTAAGTVSTMTALAQVGGGGEVGAQQAVPQALLDAVQAEGTNAVLRCWLGHYYTLHRAASPDAAHAYLQVIRNDVSRAQTHATAAEVGLAWNHLRRVPCASLQLWREGCRSAQSTSAAAALDARDVASALLCYGRGAVVDTSALRSAPPALARFLRGAVLHHAAAVHAYAGASCSGAARHPHHKRRSLTMPSSRSPQALVGAVDAVVDAHARHLRFAEEGFQRALQPDPRNVGALCGLGRLRSLATSYGSFGSSSTVSLSEGGARHGATALAGSGLSSAMPLWGAGGAGSMRAAEAQAYFAAALAAAAEHDGAAAGHAAAVASDGAVVLGSSHAHALDGVWCSYAAYWMSEECGRDNTTDAARLWLRRAVDFNPRNDWALTSLGLSLLCDTAEESNAAATALSPSPVSPHSTVQHVAPSAPRSPTSTGAPGANLRVHRGVALLQRALVINPTNTWALWGVGTYAAASPHRDACQRLLRNLIVESLRGRI